MGKKIFTIILISLLCMAYVNAQMSYSNRKAPRTEKKVIKKFSNYKPATNKRTINKQERGQRAIMTGSYKSKNYSFKERQKLRESKIQKKRLGRIKDQKSYNQKRGSDIDRRNADKKYAERESSRLVRVDRNKREFGTRESQKKNRTMKGFDLPPFSKRIRLRT